MGRARDPFHAGAAPSSPSDPIKFTEKAFLEAVHGRGEVRCARGLFPPRVLVSRFARAQWQDAREMERFVKQWIHGEDVARITVRPPPLVGCA